MKKTIKDSIISIISTCLFFGGLMALICLICCRDDPFKDNVYRVLGVMLSVVLLFLFPVVWFVFIAVITFPFRLFNKKKTKK